MKIKHVLTLFRQKLFGPSAQPLVMEPISTVNTTGLKECSGQESLPPPSDTSINGGQEKSVTPNQGYPIFTMHSPILPSHVRTLNEELGKTIGPRRPALPDNWEIGDTVFTVAVRDPLGTICNDFAEVLDKHEDRCLIQFLQSKTYLVVIANQLWKAGKA